MPSVAFTVTIDTKPLFDEMKGLERHFPYILARALTNTAIGAQAAVKATLSSKFTLRNEFTEKGIRYRAAQKASNPIQAIVFTNTENSSTGAPDYLGRQESGGEKVPVNGRAHIAIPMPALWKLLGSKKQPIPTELRPKTLLAGFVGGRYLDYRHSRAAGRQMVLRSVKLVRGWEFFIKPGNPEYIFGRYALTRERDIHPFYKLVPEVTVMPKLGMIPTVQTFVDAHFEEEWEKMWVAAAAKGIRL